MADELMFIKKSTVQATSDAIKEVKGTNDPINPINWSNEIRGLSAGGGSSELVKYVTFMSWDGSEELFVKPTIAGDDCVNIVSKGLISTPTKPSTNTQNFTYAGWTESAGGSADSNALKNITEDKSVYASFSSSVRYYKVKFYDDETDTTPTTFDVTYGSDASGLYVPEKDGFLFKGWDKPVTNITSDISVYGTWEESLTFAAASWSRIAELSESGEISTLFKVGDEKNINMNGEAVTVRIAGFNHDDLADGSGKAGVTIIAKTIPLSLKGNSPTRMSAQTERELLDGIFNPYLPDELKNAIKTIKKPCEGSMNSGTNTTDREVKIFALSFFEAGLSINMSENYYNKLGTKYELFNNTSNIIAYVHPNGTKPTASWLRGYQRTGGSNGIVVKGKNEVTTQSSSTQLPYVFGFCI